ncbi:extracellular solute-binding protein [Sporosarcina psychrophila]|uniref:ABC transporter substrate-binding protein n=1 Tax=Sporosarcina psychrophila TaxID=1476 RepID=UPI0030CBD7FA
MKRFVMSVFLVFAVVLVTMGCSNSGKDSSKVNLSFYSNVANDADKEAIEKAVALFEKENPEINIEDNYPAGEYESMLRVKMAANDMPDVFDTHGWAKERYGEYAADLSDMDWVENLDPAMNPILRDDEGKVYAYPLNQAKDGLIYNENILKEYGIEPPTSFAEFMEALKMIKEKSKGEVIPLWLAGSEKSALAQYFDQFATPLLVTHEDHNFEKELLDGTFEWSNYTYLAEKMKEMQAEKLLNIDVLTAQRHELNNLMAQGKIGFAIAGASVGPDVTELNPEIQIGVQPMPAIFEGGVQSWIGGERNTVALWKDSKHTEEAKKFIDFLAQQEIAKGIAEGTNLPAGLTNVETANYYTEYYELYADVDIEPYFDRVYLPSGMWDVMGTTAQELLSGKLEPEGVSKKMGKEYTRLREQAEKEEN